MQNGSKLKVKDKFRSLYTRRVLEGAVPASYPIFADIGVGVPHFQAADIKDPNYNANRGPSNNPRYKVAGKTLHSFWFA